MGKECYQLETKGLDRELRKVIKMCEHCDKITKLEKRVSELETRLNVETNLRNVERELRTSQEKLLVVKDAEISSLIDRVMALRRD